MDWLVAGALTILVNIVLYAVLSTRLHKQFNAKVFLDSMRQEMDLLMTEMNQSAERNVAVFEDRVKKLKVLMDELDQKLVLVRREETRTDVSAQGYGNVRNQILEARRTAAREPVRPEIQPEPVNDAPAPSEPITMSAPPPSPKAQSLARAQSREELRRRVYSLYRSGLSSQTIAQQTGMSLGEVDLVISLGEGAPE